MLVWKTILHQRCLLRTYFSTLWLIFSISLHCASQSRKFVTLMCLQHISYFSYKPNFNVLRERSSCVHGHLDFLRFHTSVVWQQFCTLHLDLWSIWGWFWGWGWNVRSLSSFPDFVFVFACLRPGVSGHQWSVYRLYSSVKDLSLLYLWMLAFGLSVLSHWFLYSVDYHHTEA